MLFRSHSERRQYFGEDDTCLIAKIRCALSQNLTVILCIGETQQQYEAGQTHSVISEQLTVLQTLVETGELNQSRFIIAYEPVWAIGTGRTATPEQAQAVHAAIRGQVAESDAAVAAKLPLLYGGSVKPENAATLFAEQDIDGALVGGAALVAEDFLAICRAAAR